MAEVKPASIAPLASTPMDQDRPPPPLPPPDPAPKPPEVCKPEETKLFEKPAFIPKPISHSPKISPSSIPNPSPSVTTSKVEGYPNYASYLYSVPGYSAFQPITYPGILQPKPVIAKTELTSSDYTPFPKIAKKEIIVNEKSVEVHKDTNSKVDLTKPQTDFEDHFMPEIVPAAPITDKKNNLESKINITSASQRSGATAPSPTTSTNKDVKKKPPERYSLKTSIPISKIDMKCVTTAPDTTFQSPVTKKIPFNPVFHSLKPDRNEGSKVEIQSNIVIKTAPTTENEIKVDNKPITTTASTNISTLIHAAEAINKTDTTHFRLPEQKPEHTAEIKEPTPTTTYAPQIPNNIARPMFSPMNLETSKSNSNKAQEGTFAEQKNQILFIQNKNPSNPKMLLTIQQQNPQVMLQRTSFESKNLQAPSRLSSQMKKSKDDLVENSSSKVVALKRLHQENCDENDFENLITENQIYGNKIVVKEKSQGTLQEQDLKNKNISSDKVNQSEAKNVVLQPNFLYLSNVQFPANLMMIKNNGKVNQTNDTNKLKMITSNENTVLKEVSTMTNNIDTNSNLKNSNLKGQNITINKEIHVLKSNNNVLQTISNKNNKTDLLFQTSNQKVIMNPQIVYQMPIIVSDTDSKLNQQFINSDYPKLINQNKKEYPKQFDQAKQNDKLFIACPYQMDAKLQPKIVITNIRHKIAKVDEVSSLDIYEKKKRIRRLKYLTNRETKDGKEQKTDTKKFQDKAEFQFKSIITPEKMRAEICKEFAKTKLMIDDKSSDSDSDYGEEELKEYDSIINKYNNSKEDYDGKAEFLANFRLATKEDYKDKDLDRQERILKRDSVASAYIAAGRLDRLTKEEYILESSTAIKSAISKHYDCHEKENAFILAQKQTFLSQLMLVRVTPQHKEGYEQVWKEIIKERQRRDGINGLENAAKRHKPEVKVYPDNQLQILTEIKNSVNENNNLIKKRLDSTEEADGDSIRILAEKNFSELNRLSKMADLSVKLYSGPNTRKRDLNPGFDSENIQKQALKEQPCQSYPPINIPNISKIISLKSSQDNEAVSSSKATSMDEPKSSAAGVQEMFTQPREIGRMQDFSCQVEEKKSWLGIEAMMKSYKEFEAARKKEISDLHRRNTSLRVECAHTTRSASRDADRARALMAERRNLAAEEAAVTASIQRLCAAIDAIKNY